MKNRCEECQRKDEELSRVITMWRTERDERRRLEKLKNPLRVIFWRWLTGKCFSGKPQSV